MNMNLKCIANSVFGSKYKKENAWYLPTYYPILKYYCLSAHVKFVQINVTFTHNLADEVDPNASGPSSARQRNASVPVIAGLLHVVAL